MHIFHLWWGRRNSSSVQHQFNSRDHCKRLNVQAETDALHITGGGEHSFSTWNVNSVWYLRYPLLCHGRPKRGRWEAEGWCWYFAPQVSAAKLVPNLSFLKWCCVYFLQKTENTLERMASRELIRWENHTGLKLINQQNAWNDCSRVLCAARDQFMLGEKQTALRGGKK